MAVLPRLIRPMLATPRQRLPTDQDRYGWEFKWEGPARSPMSAVAVSGWSRGMPSRWRRAIWSCPCSPSASSTRLQLAIATGRSVVASSPVTARDTPAVPRPRNLFQVAGG